MGMENLKLMMLWEADWERTKGDNSWWQNLVPKSVTLGKDLRMAWENSPARVKKSLEKAVDSYNRIADSKKFRKVSIPSLITSFNNVGALDSFLRSITSLPNDAKADAIRDYVTTGKFSLPSRPKNSANGQTGNNFTSGYSSFRSSNNTQQQTTGTRSQGNTAQPGQKQSGNTIYTDAISALVNTGIKRTAAQMAVSQAMTQLGSQAHLPDIIKRAFQLVGSANSQPNQGGVESKIAQSIGGGVTPQMISDYLEGKSRSSQVGLAMAKKLVELAKAGKL